MTGDPLLVFGVLAVTILLFVSNRLRLDVVALLSLLALVLTDIVTPVEALAGFSDPIVVMIAALFVVGGGLFRTGVGERFGRAIGAAAGEAVRQLAGFPDDAHPLYMRTFGAFVFIFGVAYLVTARTGRADRTFIGVAAAGKLAFFGLLVGLWLAGDLPARAPLAGLGDGVFGAIFAVWLVRTNGR